jgi:hypothetical protein
LDHLDNLVVIICSGGFVFFTVISSVLIKQSQRIQLLFVGGALPHSFCSKKEFNYYRVESSNAAYIPEPLLGPLGHIIY